MIPQSKDWRICSHPLLWVEQANSWVGTGVDSLFISMLRVKIDYDTNGTNVRKAYHTLSNCRIRVNAAFPLFL